MSKKMIFCGGIGGVTPLILTVVFADAGLVAEKIQPLLTGDINAICWLAGYFVKGLGLFAIGAFWVYLEEQGVSPARAFQMGLVAPATIMVMLSASNAAYFRNAEIKTSLLPPMIGTAYAQSRPDERTSTPSPLDSFIKGILGR